MSVADQQRIKGEDLMAEAEKKSNSGKFFGIGPGNADEVCDLYVKAGKAFKMAKECRKAGNAFAKAASIELRNQRKNKAGMDYVDAAKCYRKESPEDCERCLLKAAEIYSDVGGRGTMVAKQRMTLAELYEEQGNSEKAVEQYQLAADVFSVEDFASSSATKCLLGVAFHSATLGNFERAEEIFEQLGEASQSNKLLKYTVSEHFARAGLCYLAAKPEDGESVFRKIEEWQETSPAFTASRECTWLSRMATACQKDDLQEFNEAIKKYTSVRKLSPWEEDMLRKIRKHMVIDLR